MKNNLDLFMFKRITKSKQSKIKGGNIPIQDWNCTSSGDDKYLPTGCQ
ncbi:pilin [Aquimarina litoralis]|nr:pilin [Aquimarina litoralis]